MGPDATMFVFWMFSFKPAFPLSSFTFIKRFFSSFSLSAIKVVSSAYPRLLFLPAVLIPDCGLSGWQSAWCTPHISQISQVTIRSLDYFLSQFWMFFRFMLLHVSVCGLFFFFGWVILYYMNRIYFALSIYQLLAIWVASVFDSMNKPVMSNCVHVFVWAYTIISLGYLLRSGIAGSFDNYAF